jgi:hypothetical protein
MENIEYKIYKYELCPSESPNSTIVGFLITDTNSSKYTNIEHTLPFSETNNLTEEEICQMAFNKLKPQIDAIITRFQTANNPVIGKVFLPSS